MRLPSAVVLVLGCGAVAAQSVEFFHLTDTHLFQPDGFHPQLAGARAPLLPSLGRLAAFTREVTPRPDFLLVTGDLVDGYCFDTPAGAPLCNQVALFRGVVRRSPVRIYPALGNHDVTVYHPASAAGAAPSRDMSRRQEARTAWRNALPAFRHGTYYFPLTPTPSRKPFSRFWRRTRPPCLL